MRGKTFSALKILKSKKLGILPLKCMACFEFLGCKKIYSIFCTENPKDFLVIQNLKPEKYYHILKNGV